MYLPILVEIALKIMLAIYIVLIVKFIYDLFKALKN